MAYDALAESVALIESRRPEPVRRLSRRRRFAAMGVDVAGDVAVSMFARRGVGCVWQDNHVLALRDGQWTLLGGGSSNGEEDLLTDRPAVLPTLLRVWRGTVIGAAPRIMVVEAVAASTTTVATPSVGRGAGGGSATPASESTRRRRQCGSPTDCCPCRGTGR